MKTIKIFAALFIALVAMGSCSKADNPVAGPASQEQLDQLDGHWYAELPISGMTKNLLTTDDPDDMAPFNSIGAVIYFHNEYTDWSYWGYWASRLSWCNWTYWGNRCYRSSRLSWYNWAHWGNRCYRSSRIGWCNWTYWTSRFARRYSCINNWYWDNWRTWVTG